MKIIGVSRGCEYSPNMANSDAAIFQSVCEELQTLGYEVECYDEKDFVESGVEGDIIFDMARDSKTISRLKELEDKGGLVVNSAYGIVRCVRQPMTERLIAAGVPYPESWIVATDGILPLEVAFPCWIKRGNSHAVVKADVSYAATREEAMCILSDFKNRNIPYAVINEHLSGDLIKFYGVLGTDFFYWYYSSPASHSKFGLEAINGEAEGVAFEPGELKRHADRAAEVLNVPIYGGDCVVYAPGKMKIIDFNDWPSFSRCREEAGFNIAKCIHQLVMARTKTN